MFNFILKQRNEIIRTYESIQLTEEKKRTSLTGGILFRQKQENSRK